MGAQIDTHVEEGGLRVPFSGWVFRETTGGSRQFVVSGDSTPPVWTDIHLRIGGSPKAVSSCLWQLEVRD